ncbi:MULTISPECIES: sulfurtransferase complex subunit TusC [unclassified Pseudoalteromonas]|uniref:sulfurtransferase complex subunit TusC n=1 Tax=unclassified Pseudoalteromonas TaxID=194690 RepID=UPI003015015E
MSGNVLIISNKSPFDHAAIKEALDMALIYAAIDQEVSWLFTQHAVLALDAKLNPSMLGLKDSFKQLKTLEIYDVENVYVCAEALARFNLDSGNLSIPVIALESDAIRSLIAKQDMVVTL